MFRNNFLHFQRPIFHPPLVHTAKKFNSGKPQKNKISDFFHRLPRPIFDEDFDGNGKNKKIFFEKNFWGNLKKYIFCLMAHMQAILGPFWPQIHPKNGFWRFSRARGRSLGPGCFRDGFLSVAESRFRFFQVGWGSGSAESCGRAPAWRRR